MALYAKIDRATGAVIEYRDLTDPVRAMHKDQVMLPVTKNAKPPFNADIERLTGTVTQPDLSNLLVNVSPTAERVEGWQVDTLPLATCKANKRAKVDALLAVKIAAGRVYSGNTYQIRAQDLTNITGIRVALLSGILSPHGGIWRSILNVDVAMNDVEFALFAANVMAYIRDLIRKASAHKDGIDACANAAAVNAYDITAGWPANT